MSRAAASTEAPRKHIEAPLDGEVESKELDALAAQVLRWMREAPRDRLSVAGLNGPRGSGKTSLMRRVMKLAERSGKGREFLLPTVEDGETPIFDPGLSQSPEELLFDLLGFLERYAGSKGVDVDLESARRHAAEMTDPDRFMDLVKELAPSAGALERDLAKKRCELAAANQKLRGALKDWSSRVLTRDQVLVLPVDDADLNPQMGFATLEYIWRYMDRLPVVVVLCAHYDTLVEAVRVALADKGHSDHDLAVAYVEKHVPYRWSLRPWMESTRFDFLWESQLLHVGPRREEQVSSALQPFWLGLSLTRALDFVGQDERIAALQGRRVEEVEAPNSARDVTLEEVLAPLLPAWPRALKRLHNRLVDLGDQADLIQRWADRIGADARTTAAWLTLVLVYHVCWPSVKLWSYVKSVDKTLVELLKTAHRVSLAQHDEDEHDVKQRKQADRDLAVLNELVAEIPKQGGRQDRARADLEGLGRLFIGLSASGQLVSRLIAVNLDADAAEVATRNLATKPDQVFALDLRREGETRRPPLTELSARLDALEPRLKALETLRTGQIQVLAKAPLSVLIWLGWRLRFVPMASAYNDGPQGLALFRLPSRRLEPRNRSGLGFFAALDFVLETSGGGPPQPQPGKILLIIDLLRRVSDGDLGKFPDDLRPIRARRLQARPMDRPIESQDLPDILQDIVDQVGWLRSHDGVQEFHLAVVGPDVVAFALGRQLHALGRFFVYDWDRDSQRYVYVCRFPEDGQDATETEPAPTFFAVRADE